MMLLFGFPHCDMFAHIGCATYRAKRKRLIALVVASVLGGFSALSPVLAQQAPDRQPETKPSANAQSKTKKFEDWYYRCIAPAGKSNASELQCEVLQVAQVKTPSKGDDTSSTSDKSVSVLTLAFSKGLPAKGKKKRDILFTVLTPLNIHLPSGFEVTVDKGKPVKHTYRNCNQAGCWVNAQLSQKDVQRLKRGAFGVGQMRLLNGQNVRIKFSLKGLKRALAALESNQKIN